MNWPFPKCPRIASAKGILGGLSAVLMWNLFVPIAQAQLIHPELCSTQNSVEQDSVIVLGRVPNRPYVVVVPVQGAYTLERVRRCVPDAFQSSSSLGDFVNAGSFSNQGSAQELSSYLRSLDFDARIVYFR